VLFNLLPILSNLNLCPKQATAIAGHAADYSKIARSSTGALNASKLLSLLPKLPTN
jgi:hypothetical protein